MDTVNIRTHRVAGGYFSQYTVEPTIASVYIIWRFLEFKVVHVHVTYDILDPKVAGFYVTSPDCLVQHIDVDHVTNTELPNTSCQTFSVSII